MVVVDDWFIVRQAAEALIGTLAAAGNIIILAAILSIPTLRTSTNSLLCSLAVADTCVGLIGIPFVIINNMELPHNYYGCLIMNSTIRLLTFISVFNLVAIALERFIAVRFPVFHRNNFSSKGSKAVAVLITMTWLWGVLVGVIPLFGWFSSTGLGPDGSCQFTYVISYGYLVYFDFFGFFLIPMTIIYITYASIFVIIFRRSQPLSVTSNADKRIKRRLSREARAARRIFVVIVVFTVCWLPLHILNTLSLYTSLFSFPTLVVAILLSHLNSAINPLLYAWGNTKIRTAVYKLLHIKHTEIHHLDISTGIETTGNNIKVSHFDLSSHNFGGSQNLTGHNFGGSHNSTGHNFGGSQNLTEDTSGGNILYIA